MIRLIRRLIKIIVVLLFLVIIAGIAGFLMANKIVRKGVEVGAKYALGVNTYLDSAKVSFFRGKSSISGLTVSNPDGFISKNFLTLGTGNVALTLKSLLSDMIELPSINLNNLEINLEKQGEKSNYNVIMDNLAEFEKKLPQTKGKKFVIRELLISNIKVTADLASFGGDLTRQVVNIPEIKLKDVGSDTEKGVLLSELSGVVLKSVLTSLTENGVKLPGDILKDLGKGLNNLESISKYGLDINGTITSKVVEISDESKKAFGKEIKKGIESVGEGLKGILDKNK